jgi:tetratricopeptide (TPR) repeat protein
MIQMVELDKFAPETWCVVGNCFSLQKEHDVALRFFQRALQLDPSYTYAHTLCGHELVNNEDLEKASSSFRLAIMNDERHYNAWYGLGSVYCRQEKYALAEHHFRRALNINNASSVLKCFLSIVLHSQSLCRGTFTSSSLRFFFVIYEVIVKLHYFHIHFWFRRYGRNGYRCFRKIERSSCHSRRSYFL